MDTMARTYAHVNSIRPCEYTNFDNFVINNWANQDDYELVKKLGRGKYSEVFEAVNIKTNEICVLKVLRPVRIHVLKREVKILENLKGGVNIIALFACIQNPVTLAATLVLEHVTNTPWMQLYATFNSTDIRYYLHQLLRALDYCHSKGIMHRDVKPRNVVIDHANKKLRLIDWGLAEFYQPFRSYTVHVASRHYKAPELLVGFHRYDYSLDIWSAGCIFAGMIFHKAIFFHGRDNDDQLDKIVNVLGYKKLIAYLTKYGIELEETLNKQFMNYSRKNWQHFVNANNKHLTSANSLDLLNKLLRYDHFERLTAREAMHHSYFSDLSQL